MRKHEVESKVLDVVDRVTKKQPVEDASIELKSDWPDTKKAARRLAAHANAARGEPILWIIGIDETQGLVVGADDVELANWLPQVASNFEGNFAPSLLTNIAVPISGKTVVALCFETDRCPYLVKNLTGEGAIQYEVPWRDGNATRTARRPDLLRLLTAAERLPEVEVRFARLQCGEESEQGGEEQSKTKWILHTLLYFSPRSSSRLFIPTHKCSGSVQINDSGLEMPFDKISCDSDPRYLTRATNAGLLIEGPGLARFEGRSVASCKDADYPKAGKAVLRLVVPEADNQEIVVNFDLPSLGLVKGARTWQVSY